MSYSGNWEADRAYEDDQARFEPARPEPDEDQPSISSSVYVATPAERAELRKILETGAAWPVSQTRRPG